MNTPLQRSVQGRTLRWGWTLCALVLFFGFFSLGTWQVQRRIWKLDLIERVNQRVTAPAVEAPASPEWSGVNAANDEYRHVQLTGQFLSGHDVRVQAVTVLGSGYWLLSPLQLSNGNVVLINRGFVPPQWLPATNNTAVPRDEAPVTVTGLLRLTEPNGGFLRTNDPTVDRWFSRDVAAIAQAHGLRQVAPYFIDAEAAAAGAPADSSAPVGGLTVIAFHNSHLVYALTWYVLALMVAGAAIRLALHNGKHHEPPLSPPAAD
jgi:surfeit locus 1 family protein